MQPELGLAALAMADAVKADPDAKLPEEFLGQLIKEVVMHEVGHSLGLRHNFKASTMLDADQINDPEITRVKGMTGSVMDYNPINIAPKGQKQGDYITTVLGPYDYWAIEYAYKEVIGRRGGRAEEGRRPGPRARPGLRHRHRHDGRQRPAGERLRPRLRPLPVRQGPAHPGRRSS